MSVFACRSFPSNAVATIENLATAALAITYLATAVIGITSLGALYLGPFGLDWSAVPQ